MKLTPENQDDMDCRPINRNTGISYIPAWLQELRERRKADQVRVSEIGAAVPSEPS